ncbi:MAG TPA: zf-TFIIB domain-containing protein [Acidimicrobiia bacterium]|nr:zf-TFIIB domain-containing protein [Acidimicrobiia bacterium]
MNCPLDGETLALSERRGVEIDYCPKCRGVWLDRGELDKLMAAADRYDNDDDDDDRRRPPERREQFDRPGSDYDRGYKKPHKKKSFLSEIFEFGD